MKNAFLFFVAMLCIVSLAFASCNFNKPSTPNKPVEHECKSICSSCGKCTNFDCEEDICAVKCNGHVNLPEINVGDLE